MIRALVGLALAMPLGAVAQTAPVAPAAIEMTAPGPEGPLGGILVDPSPSAPLLLLIPGSGATDRDGNSASVMTGGYLRQLAEALAARGVATLRVDKRGIASSKAAVSNANDVTIAAYAQDAHAWIKAAREKTGRTCVWLGGHSEGALVSLQAAQTPEGICGVVLLTGPGRKVGDILRDQFRASAGNAPLLDDLLALVDHWEAGHVVPGSSMKPPLGSIFPEAVQPYLIDMMRYDPAALAAKVRVPILIVQGGNDVQVTAIEADALAKAAPKAKRVDIPRMSHVLRLAAGDSREQSLATYANGNLPIVPALVDAVVDFVSPKPR